MINRWLENDPKETLVCAVTSVISLIINLTVVVLSAAGVLDPVTGALWHNCGSVFVVVNAALLLREKD